MTEEITDSGLRAEIEEVINRGLVEAGVASKAWVIEGVLRRHVDNITGSDKPWFIFNARQNIQKSVHGVLEARGKRALEGAQPLLPGVGDLQREYATDRNGEPAIVSIERMTDAELLAKADQLDKLAAGAQRHAREIRRYVKMRAKA